MKQTEYLRENYYEPTPSWLLEIDENSKIPWKEFFASRTVFYPGSAFDPYTVNAFGRSHSAHCFVNADYLFPEERLEAELRKPMFPGYTIVYERDIHERKFYSMFDTPYSYVEDFGPAINDHGRRSFDKIRHFVKFLVFERESGRDDTFGVERFALLFVGGDAFPLFNALYANKNANLFAMLIEDYGFGCQYAYFRKGELLHKIARNTGTFPELILTSRCRDDMWNGYECVTEEGDPREEDLGREFRWLYRLEAQPRRHACAAWHHFNTLAKNITDRVYYNGLINVSNPVREFPAYEAVHDTVKAIMADTERLRIVMLSVKIFYLTDNVRTGVDDDANLEGVLLRAPEGFCCAPYWKWLAGKTSLTTLEQAIEDCFRWTFLDALNPNYWKEVLKDVGVDM